MTRQATERSRRLGMMAALGVAALAAGRADASPELVNLAATNVTDTTAGMNGSLLATGTVPYAVWVYWDTEDRTTNRTWAEGHAFGEHLVTDLTWQATGLTPNTNYYYTYYASNATAELWAQPSVSFRTWGPPSVDNGGGATNIGARRATLRGRLLAGVGAQATVYWWTGASASNSAGMGWVAEGQDFAFTATGLQDDAVYSYRCFVSNDYGTAWSETTDFMTPVFDGHYYVATNGPPGGDGSSWEQAFTNLQTALAQAFPGDTIHLAAHTFRNSSAGLSSQYVWTNKTLTILGGYAADGGRPGALTNLPTILTRPSGTNRILYINGVTGGTLQRVTLTGGSLYRAPGAGLYVGACSNLVLADCVISNNYNSTDNNPGGTTAAGAYFTGSSVRLTNCVVTLNTAYGYGKNYAACAGGGLYVAGGNVTLDECVVNGNWANGHAGCKGGGIYVGSGNVTISNSVVLNNKSRNTSDPTKINGYGGGVFMAGGTLAMRNTLLYGNEASALGYGYGIRVEGTSAAALNNCTVASHAGDALNRAAGTLTVTNSILWGNSDDIIGTVSTVNCDIQGGDSNGSNGCFSADPVFQGGYYLDSASPCVNTGNVTAAEAGLDHRTTRIDGQPDDGVVDLGYHYPSTAMPMIPDLYVAPDGDDVLNAGTNALTPFRTITKALATLTDGTRVHIAAGNYTNGMETFPLTVAGRSGVQLLGTNCAATIINASGSGRRVLSLTGASGATRLEGLTFTGGQPDAGGLYLASCSDVSIVSCVISNNRYYAGTGVASSGGGLYLQDSGARLTNTAVVLNSVYGSGWSGDASGGGIGLRNSIAVLADCRIERNGSSSSESGYGGGIHMASGSLTVSNSVIVGNTVKNYGGGVSAVGGTLTMVNVLATGNWSASTNSDGIYAGGSSARFINCTVATNRFVGIRYAAGAVAMTNCIVWGHAMGDIVNFPSSSGVVQNVGFSLLGGPAEMNGVNGCIVGDPRFVDAATNDFSLQRGSPAVNSGYTLPGQVGDVDLAGNRRVTGGAVDMGAYERAHAGAMIIFR